MNDALHFPFHHSMALAGVTAVGLSRFKTGPCGVVAMTLPASAFTDFLATQRADYRRSLPERLAQIDLLWCRVRDDEAPAQALADLERCAHNLAGSGATFGFAALGDTARALEQAVVPLLGTAGALTPAATREVGAAVEALQRCLSGES
ncbi:MAG: hypothetical protein B7X59_07220 [Polaromonas sp. 39-63-203]|jgi:chemotaxis protein histidine kinase CheA|nr:MAG: hypothetical protein B7Y54_05800 [Polaromonas sp. 35-63-240]OYZ83730.1 MAG: hypothetical protein B7Y03_07630 [Polaromonas sp. 24-62-144]OZA97834.1 MAG: hypothetical protein B7X59_07220 [Polaromonas sp. 39-63-203]